MSILARILSEMYVEPELLAELDEEQKQILFCKLREEQLRRCKERERLEIENGTVPEKKNNGRRLQFLTGADGEPWTWVMGEHESDKSIEQLLEEEARLKAQKLAELETAKLREMQLRRALATAGDAFEKQAAPIESEPAGILCNQSAPAVRKESPPPVAEKPRSTLAVPIANGPGTDALPNGILDQLENWNGAKVDQTGDRIAQLLTRLRNLPEPDNFEDDNRNREISPPVSTASELDEDQSLQNLQPKPDIYPPEPEDTRVQKAMLTMRASASANIKPPEPPPRKFQTLPGAKFKPPVGIGNEMGSENLGLNVELSPDLKGSEVDVNVGVREKQKISANATAPSANRIIANADFKLNEMTKSVGVGATFEEIERRLIERKWSQQTEREIEFERERRQREIYESLKAARRHKDALDSHESDRLRSEQENSWVQSERKARLAEEEIRRIARMAREQHRRHTKSTDAHLISALEKSQHSSASEDGRRDSSVSSRALGSQADGHNLGLKISAEEKSSVASHVADNVGSASGRERQGAGRRERPASRAAIVRWFQADELPRASGLDPKTRLVAIWFHADSLLQHRPPGAYLIRVSDRIFGYALSCVASDLSVRHFLIERSVVDGFYSFLGNKDGVRHATLFELVNYHQSVPVTASGCEVLIEAVGQLGQQKADYAELFARDTAL